MLKRIGFVLAVLVGVIAIKYGLRYLDQVRDEQTAEQAFDEMANEAAARNPDATPQEAAAALQAVATERAARLVAAGDSDDDRRAAAIATFSGFFYVNVVTRPEYCRQQGVEIPAFVEAFTAAHREELGIARDNGVDVQSRFRIPQYRQVLDKAARPTIEADMRAIQDNHGLSAAAACELFDNSAQELASRLRLSVTQPEVYAALRL